MPHGKYIWMNPHTAVISIWDAPKNLTKKGVSNLNMNIILIYYSSNFIMLGILYLPSTVGFPLRYVKIYLFKNKVHPLKIYHSKRNTSARILNNPLFGSITVLSELSLLIIWFSFSLK